MPITRSGDEYTSSSGDSDSQWTKAVPLMKGAMGHYLTSIEKLKSEESSWKRFEKYCATRPDKKWQVAQIMSSNDGILPMLKKADMTLDDLLTLARKTLGMTREEWMRNAVEQYSLSQDKGSSGMQNQLETVDDLTCSFPQAFGNIDSPRELRTAMSESVENFRRRFGTWYTADHSAAAQNLEKYPSKLSELKDERVKLSRQLEDIVKSAQDLPSNEIETGSETAADTEYRLKSIFDEICTMLPSHTKLTEAWLDYLKVTSIWLEKPGMEKWENKEKFPNYYDRHWRVPLHQKSHLAVTEPFQNSDGELEDGSLTGTSITWNPYRVLMKVRADALAKDVLRRLKAEFEPRKPQSGGSQGRPSSVSKAKAAIAAVAKAKALAASLESDSSK